MTFLILHNIGLYYKKIFGAIKIAIDGLRNELENDPIGTLQAIMDTYDNCDILGALYDAGYDHVLQF